MYSKSPWGCRRWIVIAPVLSLDVMPEMWPLYFGPEAANASAPLTFEKRPILGDWSLKSRSIVAPKSLAFTGVPSEYFSPLRSFSLYVLPSAETFGMSCARYGTSVAPAGPLTCRYPISGRYEFQSTNQPCGTYERPGSRKSIPSACATRKSAKALGFFEDELVVVSPADVAAAVLPPVLVALWLPPQPAARSASEAQMNAQRKILRFNRTSRSFVRRPKPRPFFLIAPLRRHP